jgi:hypothetical protein
MKRLRDASWAQSKNPGEFRKSWATSECRDVLRVTGVALNADETQIGQRGNLFRQRDGMAGIDNTRPCLADVDIDGEIERETVGQGGQPPRLEWRSGEPRGLVGNEAR